MRKKKLMLVMGVLLMGLVFSNIGYATEKGLGHHSCRGFESKLESEPQCAVCMLKQKEDLGLSDEQITQLKSLKNEAEKKRIRNEAEMKILKIELRDLVHQDKTEDLKAVDAKIEKIGALFTTMKKNHVYARLDAKKVLTPDQQKKFKEHQETKCAYRKENSHYDKEPSVEKGHHQSKGSH